MQIIALPKLKPDQIEFLRKLKTYMAHRTGLPWARPVVTERDQAEGTAAPFGRRSAARPRSVIS